MTIEQPRPRFDWDRLLVAFGFTASAAYGILAVAHLLLHIAGGR
jgi:hypothetical protein